jgi:hypothetical protein
VFPVTIRAALVTHRSATTGSDPSGRPHSTRPPCCRRAAAGLAGLLVAIAA